MVRFQKSIQKKVRIAYYMCLGLIIVVAISNYFNIKTIERKIMFSMIISQFFDATLEMRRFEKNYIIYRGKEDYLENLNYTRKAEDIIKTNTEAIKKLSPKSDISVLKSTIADYKSLMFQYFNMGRTVSPLDSHILEGKIREKGKKLVDTTEAIALAERQFIRSSIKHYERVILSSIVILIVAGCLIGQYLSRMVVRPLKNVENSMKKIAEGHAISLSIDSSDREIVSLSSAFNKMLKELKLRQMRLIVQSEKLASLGTMVSGVAHELNNPLSNISTSCQILHEEIETSDLEFKKRLLEQIEEEIERAKNIVLSLLDFSRKKEFQIKPLPLRYLVEETMRLMQGDIPTGVELRVDIPEDSWVIADKQRLQQAFLNIIKNAIDAIPGEGVVYISAKEDPGNKLLQIDIRDTGIGIEPENIKNIFDPFYTTKDSGKGSGLGLFVAREIVSAHNGIIDVESKAGAGTTFSIKLPLKEQTDGAQSKTIDS